MLHGTWTHQRLLPFTAETSDDTGTASSKPTLYFLFLSEGHFEAGTRGNADSVVSVLGRIVDGIANHFPS